ncbi:Peptidase S24-like [Roseovarius marisflavi]|uniref:Peptidase S24-like n=2 Tax=Roseovarius marisflavi TaxID=1054996 RepID=A0A1M7B2S3_9RHOB|nr:Peptidase S24-like [Roseovarius marisflavi]
MIKEGIKEKGLRPYARDLGVSVGVLRSIQSGRDTPYSSLKDLARALGLEFYIGPPRETGPIYIVSLDGADYAPIPWVDARLAAGAGAENGDVSLQGALAFRRDWLRERDISPASVCLLTVTGDSMAPTLHDGDLVMIDERRTAIRNRHVYALVDIDGSARVKRLDLVENELIVLTSDNPTHPAETRRGDDMNRLRILGEIVWSAHAW